MSAPVDVAALVERLRAMETAMQMTFHQPPTRDALLTVRAAAEQLEALTQPVSDEDVGQVEHDLRFYGAGMYTQDTMTRGADMIARLVRERDARRDDIRTLYECIGVLQKEGDALTADIKRQTTQTSKAATMYANAKFDVARLTPENAALTKPVEDGEVARELGFLNALIEAEDGALSHQILTDAAALIQRLVRERDDARAEVEKARTAQIAALEALDPVVPWEQRNHGETVAQRIEYVKRIISTLTAENNNARKALDDGNDCFDTLPEAVESARAGLANLRVQSTTIAALKDGIRAMRRVPFVISGWRQELNAVRRWEKDFGASLVPDGSANG